jgi:hypothetical protein
MAVNNLWYLVCAFLFAVASYPPLSAEELPVLEHIATHTLPEKTHRPEILIADSGDFILVVVEPSGQPSVGQVKHKAYRFDAEWNQIGSAFVVSRTTSEYGEPADHRAALINGELVVVYQTLNFAEGTRPQGGPMEQYATDQSLILARFSLNGEERFREPIVAHAPDKDEDNFPDHCLLWWNDRLLISTGGHRKLKIREVDLDANILATHTFRAGHDTIPGEIGNSLLALGQDLLVLHPAIRMPTQNFPSRDCRAPLKFSPNRISMTRSAVRPSLSAIYSTMNGYTWAILRNPAQDRRILSRIPIPHTSKC